MRIAFLVQAHANILQLTLLARALRAAGGDVYVHLDSKSKEDPAPLAPLATLVQRIPVFHGGFSQVDATLLKLRAAMRQGYDHYFLLSGQCFPIKSAQWLAARLAAGGDFLNCYPMPRDRSQKRLDRLQHFHFERHAQSRWHALLNRAARRLPKRDFVNGLSLWPYAGSNWWCLRDSTVRYIDDYVNRHPDFVRYMRLTAYADEVFFQSVVSNMGIQDELRPALFCADFDAHTCRPRTYTSADIDMLDAREAYVARKFDLESSPDVLMHYAAFAGG